MGQFYYQCRRLVCSFFFIFFTIYPLKAGCAKTESLCAVLEGFQGDLEILDSDRKSLILPVKKKGIPCGAFLSIQLGWASLHHKNGSFFRMSSETFIQVRAEKDEDLAIFQGRVYMDVHHGNPPFRALSPVGRVRLSHGKALVVVRSESGTNQTQLIALENFATLENRFEPDPKVKVSAGEMTELNFKWVRVIPSAPTLVSVASLRPHLTELQLSFQEQIKMMDAITRHRGEKVIQRKIANETPAPLQSSESSEDAPPGEVKIMEKLVGGDPKMLNILSVEMNQKQFKSGQFQIIDPEASKDRKEVKEEKKRIIDELNALQSKQAL